MAKKLTDVQKMDIEVGWQERLLPGPRRKFIKVIQNWSARGWGFRLNYTRTEVQTEESMETRNERS